ncbi:MAG: FAM173B-like protein [archaeon GW2011_AR5]|nr:MAG: FAM173B-like protein [archaeon GW2011_AR5]
MISTFRAKIVFLLFVLFILLLANWGTYAGVPMLVLFVVACSVYVPSFFGSYWTPTEAKAVERVIREVKARNGAFYDIGSGDARVVEAVAKAGFTSVGIEIDPLKWLFSTARLKIRGVRNARILRTSFYKADLSGADIIFCYLPNKTLEKLEPRMKKLRGKTIICYRIKFPTMKPAKEFEKEKVYVYKT